MPQTLTDQTAPVNPYEDFIGAPSESYAEEIHRQIAEDLKEFGEVIKTSGSIAHTRRHGIVFHDLTITLRHAWLRMPLKVFVERNPETKKLSYYNERRHPILTGPKSYSSEAVEMHPEECRVLMDVVARVRESPVFSSPTLPLGGPSYITEKVFASGVLTGSVPVVADILVWDPFDMAITALLGLSLFGGGVVVGLQAALRNHRRESNAVNREVEKWNRDRQQALNDLFVSSSEQTMFIDALMSLCDSCDVEYQGRMKVSPAWLRNPVRFWDYGTPLTPEKLIDNESNDDFFTNQPFLHGVIEFQGKTEWMTEMETIYFDGRHFYTHDSGGHRMTCPIA